MTLRVVLEPRPLERVPAALALAGVFADERPLRGAAGRADWRLCGLLSELIESGSMHGNPGEATLVGTSGHLASEALIVVGLGPRRGFDADACQLAVRTAFERAAGLAAPSAAIGSLGWQMEELATYARPFVDGALAGLAGTSLTALLCVSEGDEERVRRELLRCGRTGAIEIGSLE